MFFQAGVLNHENTSGKLEDISVETGRLDNMVEDEDVENVLNPEQGMVELMEDVSEKSTDLTHQEEASGDSAEHHKEEDIMTYRNNSFT